MTLNLEQEQLIRSAFVDLLAVGGKAGPSPSYERLDTMLETFAERVKVFARSAHKHAAGFGAMGVLMSPAGSIYRAGVLPMHPSEPLAAYFGRLRHEAQTFRPMFSAQIAEAERTPHKDDASYAGPCLHICIEQPLPSKHEGSALVWLHPDADLELAPTAVGHGLYLVETWWAPIIDGVLGEWNKGLAPPKQPGVIYPGGKHAPQVV